MSKMYKWKTQEQLKSYFSWRKNWEIALSYPKEYKLEVDWQLAGVLLQKK